MTNAIKLKYQAADGYMGGQRPLYCSISLDEIHECDTLEDAVQLAQDAIADDFSQRVSADYDLAELEKKVAEAFATKEREQPDSAKEEAFMTTEPWKTRPISCVCEVLGKQRGSTCGKPTAWAYQAMGEGWMALCEEHAVKHHSHATPIGELIESGESFA